jgi:excisionase family DNA binding protein
VFLLLEKFMLSTKVLLSLKEFSFLAGLSLRTVTKLIASGEIKSIRVGRRRLVARAEVDRFAQRDHSTKKEPAEKNQEHRVRPSHRISQATVRALAFRKSSRYPGSSRDERDARVRAFAALARMRRDNLSLAEATRQEGIKPSTFLRYVGTEVYRSGPGKPWRATKSDNLSIRMTVLTRQGPTAALVRGSRERIRLARYDIALRKWRAGEHGAEKELMAFRGQTVGGYVLITDPDLLIRLEEAGQLDFDNLYSLFESGS